MRWRGGFVEDEEGCPGKTGARVQLTNLTKSVSTQQDQCGKGVT